MRVICHDEESETARSPADTLCAHDWPRSAPTPRNETSPNPTSIREIIMKKYIVTAAVLLLSSTSAFATAPNGVLQAVASCCSAVGAVCCALGLPCC